MQPNTKSHLQNSLSRRDFLRLSGVFSGAALLVSCGINPTEVPTAMVEKLELSFWTPGGSDTFCQIFNDIAVAYKAIHPNVTIAAAQCYAGDQSFNEVLISNVAAGSPPNATILWTSPTAFAARDVLEPLDDFMADSLYSKTANWPAGVLSSCQYKGKTYGLPATAGSYGLFYNQELFESLGIASKREDFPKTWDELRRISKEITRWNGDNIEVAGFIPFSNPADLGTIAVELAIWSALNGGQLFDPANLKYTLDSAQNIEMMQYALDWYEEQYKGDLVKVRTSANWGGYPDDQGRAPAFQSGQLAVLPNGFWFAGDIYGVETKFKNWDVAKFPVGPSGDKTYSGYWPNWLVIPKGSKNAGEAFKYLDYISGEGVKLWFSKIPDMPTNTTVATDTVPQAVVEKRGQEFATDLTTFFRNQFNDAAPMWNSPVQDFGNDQIGRAVEQILSKSASVKDALSEAQKVCQAELDKTLSK